MRVALALGFLGSVLLACGGSTSNVNEADGGCPEPVPTNMNCLSCGDGTVPPVCKEGAWACPPTPPCATLPLDSGVDSTVSDGSTNGDSSAGDSSNDSSTHDSSTGDSSTSDGGFACVACDPQTHYCQVDYPPPPNDGGAGVPTDTCLALPTCDAAPSCACVTVGPFCTCADSGGDITVTCPFHV